MTVEDLAGLSRKELIGLVLSQAEQIALLTARVRELEERLGRNSRNSSKPPSSDGPQVARARRGRVGGRQRGGQAGHSGRTRDMVPTKDVDRVVVCKPDACEACGALLLGEDRAPERHQVEEVPPVKPEITEYQRHRLTCQSCGHRTSGQWPAGVTASRFGPHLQGLAGLLRGRFRLSQREVAEAMEVCWGVSICAGSVAAIQKRLSAALADPHAQAHTAVQTSEVVHADETLWRENKRKAWVWVAATMTVVLFLIQPRRNGAAAKRLLGATFGGLACTDRHDVYHWLDPGRRQFCWSHLLRDFQAMIERGGSSQWYGLRLLQTARRMLVAWRAWREGEIDRATLLARVEPERARIHNLLTWAAAAPAAGKTRGVAAEILKHETSLWTFLAVEAVVPDNNYAERCLRPVVLWRKGSFGTDSADGSRFTERILTTVATLRAQDRSVLDFLVAAYQAHVSNLPAPSLLPV